MTLLICLKCCTRPFPSLINKYFWFLSTSPSVHPNVSLELLKLTIIIQGIFWHKLQHGKCLSSMSFTFFEGTFKQRRFPVSNLTVACNVVQQSPKRTGGYNRCATRTSLTAGSLVLYASGNYCC